MVQKIDPSGFPIGIDFLPLTSRYQHGTLYALLGKFQDERLMCRQRGAGISTV